MQQRSTEVQGSSWEMTIIVVYQGRRGPGGLEEHRQAQEKLQPKKTPNTMQWHHFEHSLQKGFRREGTFGCSSGYGCRQE